MKWKLEREEKGSMNIYRVKEGSNHLDQSTEKVDEEEKLRDKENFKILTSKTEQFVRVKSRITMMELANSSSNLISWQVDRKPKLPF